MKTIIAVWGAKNTGKTTAILKTYEKLLDLGAIIEKQTGSLNDDIYAILNYKSKKIGIISMGDPSPNEQESEQGTHLADAATEECDIIICACRTKDETLANIHKTISKGYDVVWASPLSRGKYNETATNERVLANLFSNTLIELINNL